MFKKLRLLWNCLILIKNWDTVEKSHEMIHNARSVWSTERAEKLTLEEMEAVYDLERIGRIIGGSIKVLKTDLKLLRKSLAK